MTLDTKDYILLGVGFGLNIAASYAYKHMERFPAKLSAHLSLKRRAKIENEYRQTLYYLHNRDEFREKTSATIASAASYGFLAVALMLITLILPSVLHVVAAGMGVEVEKLLISAARLVAAGVMALAVNAVRSELDFVRDYTWRIHNFGDYESQVQKKLGYVPQTKQEQEMAEVRSQ